MTATSITAGDTIPFTARPFGAEGTWVGSHAYSEPVDRSSDVDSRGSLVPLEVVNAAHNGDRDSLGRLCEIIHPRLIGFYRYSGLTAHEAEDLSGDVIEDVITRLSSLRKTKAFDGMNSRMRSLQDQKNARSMRMTTQESSRHCRN